MMNCVVILGPTASGKTALATRLAARLNGEVISADSRQVYKGLDIGTGKDLQEYVVEGVRVPYHLIDIVDAHHQYYLHEFVRDARMAFDAIVARGKLPIFCGGTGLYLDTLHKSFDFTQVPEDLDWRLEAATYNKESLLELLSTFPVAYTEMVDRHSVKRLVRGIEIARYRQSHSLQAAPPLVYKPLYIGTHVSREARHLNIVKRLALRLEGGLIEETQRLLNEGVSPERLDALGLEYRFVLKHLQRKLTKEDLQEQLATAIRQFSRRQMTWFRKMEKEGIEINWLDMQESKVAIDQAIQLVRTTFSL